MPNLNLKAKKNEFFYLNFFKVKFNFIKKFNEIYKTIKGIKIVKIVQLKNLIII